MSEPTREQIEKFVRIRNESEFNTNLQVCFDANAAGFSVDDLPQAVQRVDGGYDWTLSIGTLREAPGGWGMEFIPNE